MVINDNKKYVLITWQGATVETGKSLKSWIKFNEENENIEYQYYPMVETKAIKRTKRFLK